MPDEEPILITPDMIAQKPARPSGKPPPRPPDGRVDFERGMRRFPPLILALIIANVVVFAWELSAGAFVNAKEAIESGMGSGAGLNPLLAGALVRERVVAGEWWRMITATFLHGGPDHLIGNMVVLFIVGMACEHSFGAARTALIYFGSGLAGTTFSMASGPGPSVGASGAIFGVLMAVAVMLYRNQKAFYVRDKRIGFVLLVWAGWTLFTGLMDPFVDNFAHLGGMAGGAVAALLLTPTLTARAKSARAV
ncbi:MAG TPA: rhomboid family intramembrane serine protease [Gemmatimonadales bacterium]|jgi:rhomboid protease GluP